MPRNLIHANVIADHQGVFASPGAILLDDDTIIGIGSPQEIGEHCDARFTQIHGTVMPSFVNAHTHLDLSGVGISPPKGTLMQWVEEVVLPIRLESGEHAIKAAVQQGVALSIAGGSRVVGDIAGSMQAAKLVIASELVSISFVEVFGLGAKQQFAIEQISTIHAPMGVQPHALYSCGEDVYAAAFASGRPVATHVSETVEELQCTMDGNGSIVNFAKRIGAWDASVIPWNAHPVDAILSVAGQSHLLAAHLNYIEDRHLALLGASNITVVFCPRASTYFGHEGHQWKEMIAAGINVALGTDSLICLDTPDRISVLDDMRLLYARDNGDPKMLFSMASVHGAVGLGIDPSLVELKEGETAGLLAFDGVCNHPLVEILESTMMPTWVHPCPQGCVGE